MDPWVGKAASPSAFRYRKLVSGKGAFTQNAICIEIQNCLSVDVFPNKSSVQEETKATIPGLPCTMILCIHGKLMSLKYKVYLEGMKEKENQ